MKKIGVSLLTAVLGGAVAVGGYKLFEDKQFGNMTLEEQQKVYYANNPGNEIMSSTGNPDFTQAAAAVSPGVVHIKVTMTARGSQRGGGGSPFDMFEEFFGMPQQRRQAQPRQAQASGSGVILTPDGYIVTNNHVVENADKIEVQLTDKRTFEAKVIGRDPNTDLALLKVSATNLPMVRMGDSDNVQIGEWVLAVGYPLSLQSTVTAGIVSAKGRQIGILGDSQQQQPRGYGYGDEDQQIINTAIESFIQTDAVINKGNSGGALVNARGELIGINSAIASPTGVYAGYGFAIPINLAKKVLDDFKEFGSVKRGFIGVTFTEISEALRKDKGIDDINGLYVQNVVKGGAAESAGIKGGDIITKIEGRTIYSSSDLQERVARLRPGDKVKITYKRDGKEKDVTLTLKAEEDSKGKAGDEGSSASATEIFNKLGASFIPATDARKKDLGVSSGVVVTQVHRGGVFEYFGVEKGLVITEVNGKPVNNVDDVESALSATKRNIVRIKGVPQRGSTVELNVPIEY
ncbi:MULTISPECIES: Do family serine endopeptidase [Sphingobacterium]|uniref:Do family serine endopeptidase n=1 Tax=Sphingobacterium litopenaei TaxID=2763500 RepID=A0ABR7YI75_9SPHI|nr:MULTISPECIES: Do family serine endopeptidase [Sphingobacterium]MBD1431019.1 Do family serine endopeptidase [Sphingobacterium litopenaei]NGM74682.1 Do family serine endopeptidase [Sphingobacterium sp. SGL-16]